jgi:hypothetical protein
VGPFKILASRPFPDEGYDPVALLKNMGYPPVKGWLVVNADGHSILSGLKWMRGFKVRKVFPGG